jgi:hypothetical protein
MALRARSLAAAVALAWSTVVGVLAAVAALLPASLNGGPLGRRLPARLRPHRAEPESAPAPSAERAVPP